MLQSEGTIPSETVDCRSQAMISKTADQSRHNDEESRMWYTSLANKDTITFDIIAIETKMRKN